MALEMETLVASLKEWINEQQEIPDTSETDLKLFITLANGDLDSAKRKLFNFYTLRVNAFEGLFERRDIDSELLTNIRSIFQIFMVPKQTPEGYRVLISHAVNSETKLYDMMGHMKYFVMTLESNLVDEYSPGYIIIFDISTLTTGHILKFSPSGIKKTSTYLQEGIPVDIISVNLVNASPLVDIMMKTAKPFLNMDLLKRTFIYKAGDIEKLYQRVPKECLPQEYGGTLGNSAELNEINTNKLRALKEKFCQEEKILRDIKEKEKK